MGVGSHGVFSNNDYSKIKCLFYFYSFIFKVTVGYNTFHLSSAMSHSTGKGIYKYYLLSYQHVVNYSYFIDEEIEVLP